MSRNPSQDPDLLFRQFSQLYDEGRFPEAIEPATRARDLARRSYGEGHPAYAGSLNNLAMVYEAMGDYAAAVPLSRQALEIYRVGLGEGHPDYAASMNNLAVLYHRMGDYAAAEPLFRQALEIQRAALGEGHPDYAASLNNLAKLYGAVGDYAAAVPLSRQALEIYRVGLGEGHPDYAASLNNLAVLYHRMGDYAGAVPLYRRAMKIYRAALGEGHPDYAASLSDLAVLYRAMGDYAAAVPLSRQAMEIRRAALGEGHPDYAASLNNLAVLYGSMGDYAAAEPLCRQAMEIRRAALGEGHPDYAASLHNQAMLYEAMGDYAAAEPLCRQAMEIRRAALGEGHLDYAASMNNLAVLYRSMGDYAAAEPLCRRAMEICRATLGEGHPSYANSVDNLAILYEAMGDYAAAEPLYRRTMEIWRAALGEGHPDYAAILHNRALLSVAMGHKSDALAMLQQAAAIYDQMIGQIFGIGSDQLRAGFLATIQRTTDVFLSMVLNHLDQSREAVQAAFDLVLRRKALRSEGQATQRDALLGGRYPDLQPRLRELQALSAKIVQKTLTGPAKEGPKAQHQQLREWAGQRDGLEAELARRIPEMNLERKLRAADRRAVAMRLSEGVMLVEFVRFDVYDFKAVPARAEAEWKPARYVAFVLRAADPDQPRLIDLGEAGPIDRLIADFRAGVLAEAEGESDRDMEKRREKAPSTAASDSGHALRAALFDRLALPRGGHTRLLLAPDGDLARLPFEVLPTADGRRLIDDYPISYLSCGRDVLRFGAASSGEPAPPMILADPDFDLERVSIREPSQPRAGFWSRLVGRGKKAPATPEPPVSAPATATRAASRHSRDLDRDRSAYHFHRLPGTRAEGERVATLLGVSPWLDATALEGRLKTACRSPRILHLATHGFFLADQPRDLDRDGRGIGFDIGAFSGRNVGSVRLSGPMMENPMLGSGLALAGANTWLKAGLPPEEAEDGMLTAEDVTGLDLLATELVVLSACETGLGQVHVGEGVFGLRRAFVLAGAKTLVMSLWKVPDEPTRELMEDFYGRLLAGQGRAEALRGAQLGMKAKYPDPFYWGAFICQGDPSPLRQVQSSDGRADSLVGGPSFTANHTN